MTRRLSGEGCKAEEEKDKNVKIKKENMLQWKISNKKKNMELRGDGARNYK